MPKLRQIPSTPNEVKVPVITFKRENLHESSKLGGEPWMDRDVLLDQSLLPNPKDGFANAILKVVGKPRLKEGVFKYIPEIVQDVFVRADQFTMTNTFYWLDHGMRNAFKIGYPIYEQKVNINTCTMVNAWFSLSTKEITLCTPTSPDADVPLHEYGHRHLYEARPDFFKSDNKDAFHEYYADEFDKTAMFDREIGESTMYHIYGASAPIEKIDAGLRTLADARKTKYHDFMTSEPHRRSLPFSGVIEILFDDLTDPKGDFQISEYDAWQFRSHLVKNSVNFLPMTKDLRRQDFYWSLEGSLAGLELDKTAQKFIPESKLGLLHKRLREICLEKEFIKPEDLKEGGAIPISDRPKFAFDASQTPTASYEFAGGVRHFHQQYLELPSGFKVPVQHHGVMVRQLNNMKKPAPEFNGLRDLSEINSSINLKPEDAKAKMFNTLKIIMGDASKFNFVINEKIGERSPVNTKLYKDIMTDFVNNTKMKDVKGEPVIIDGKNTIQYKFEVGPLTMYIDAFDPKAEPYFESNIIIN